MELTFQVYAKIKKPVAEVFDAVYNPQKLSGYFTTAGANAPLDAGTTVMWDFADFPGAFPVRVKECVKNEKIVLECAAAGGEYNTTTTMTFQPLDDSSTRVEISESGWQETPEGLKSSYDNCMGWSQMLCCLKVYVEHGINLREFLY